MDDITYTKEDQLIELMVAPVLFTHMINDERCVKIVSDNGWGGLKYSQFL